MINILHPVKKERKVYHIMVSNDILCGEYVQEKEQKAALSRLDGMSYKQKKELIGIQDDYYLNKILNALVPMSGYVYFKIVPDKPYNSLFRYCIHCGQRIVANKTLYCPECSDNKYVRSISKRIEFIENVR